MKNLRRLPPKWSNPLLFTLAVLAMFGIAFLNTESRFDVYWVIGTGLIAALITFLIIAPKLLPIADTREEYLSAYRIFLNHIPGELLSGFFGSFRSRLLGFSLFGLLSLLLLGLFSGGPLGGPLGPLGGLLGFIGGLLGLIGGLLGILSGLLSLLGGRLLLGILSGLLGGLISALSVHFLNSLLLGLPDLVGLLGLFSRILFGLILGILLVGRLLFDLLYGPPPLTLVRDGKVISTTQPETVRTRNPNEEDEWPPRGVIVTDGTSVMALRTPTGISRAVGAGTGPGQSPSGVIFTDWYETIDTIIDLRPQLRLVPLKKPVPMQTRDGISIGARVLAAFTLKGTKSRRMCDLAKVPLRYPPPFAWRGSSVWHVINSKRIDDKEQKTEWGDRVMGLAIPRLRQIIAQYTVDYLTSPLTLPKHPRFEVRKELRETVERELEGDKFNPQSGLEVRFMAVPIMWPPPKVVTQRLESWKSEWGKKEKEIMGQAEAEVIRTREQARAQVQGEMTARINDALREAKASGTDNSDLITLRFLEAMEKMAKDPTTRALLTLDSLKILKQLREMLMPAQPDGSKDSSK